MNAPRLSQRAFAASPRPRRRTARRGVSLVHAITMIFCSAVILASVAFSLTTLRNVQRRLDQQLRGENTWLRFSEQFRRDCHAAVDAHWEEAASEAPADGASQDPLPGRRLWLTTADGASLEYVVQANRIVRRAREGDEVGWESYPLPIDVQCEWRWYPEQDAARSGPARLLVFRWRETHGSRLGPVRQAAAAVGLHASNGNGVAGEESP